MKKRTDFVTNSSSSSFIVTNHSDEVMTAKDVILSLIAKVLEDAEDRFILDPGDSLRIECGDDSCDGAFENFIHDDNTVVDGAYGDRYGDGRATVEFEESHH